MADLPEGFDLEALLAPIPGDAPQGIDIREDFSATSPYNRLRDARSEARDAERLRDARPDAGEGGQSAGDPNIRDPAPLWRTVRELGIKTLAETTKDLEVAAWMTEALVRSHGLAGLACRRANSWRVWRRATGMACFRCRTTTAWKRVSRRSPG